MVQVLPIQHSLPHNLSNSKPPGGNLASKNWQSVDHHKPVVSSSLHLKMTALFGVRSVKGLCRLWLLHILTTSLLSTARAAGIGGNMFPPMELYVYCKVDK